MSEFKEPWRVRVYGDDCVIYSSDDIAIKTLYGKDGKKIADRIVACVNRLAPFTTEEIEKGIDLVQIMDKLQAAESKNEKWKIKFDEAISHLDSCANKLIELELALERVRGITVEEIGKITNQSISTGKFSYLDIADAIHRLLTERMEGE